MSGDKNYGCCGAKMGEGHKPNCPDRELLTLAVGPTEGDWVFGEWHDNGKASVYSHNWQEHNKISEDGEEVVICDVTDDDTGRAVAICNLALLTESLRMFKLLGEAEHDLRQGAHPSDEWMAKTRELLARIKTACDNAPQEAEDSLCLE